MASRKEIRKELEDLLYDRYGSYGVTIDRGDSTAILSYLHSKGVVIKVPIEGKDMQFKGAFKTPQEISAVEPLI